MVNIGAEELQCAYCGKLFQGRPRQMKMLHAFCSCACSNRSNGDKRSGTHYPGKTVTRTCDNCGKEIIRARSSAQLDHIFCNRACHAAWQRGAVPWNKGKPWSDAVKKRISLAEKQTGRSAGHNNPASKTEGPWENVVCASCGRSFHLPPYAIKAGGNYCSPKCASAGHSQKMRGPSNPSWLGGNKDGYSTEFLCDLRPFVRKRDKACRICGRKEDKEHLCVHHIDYNKANDNIWNLVALCRDCHGKTNKNRAAWTEKFTQMAQAS